MPAPSWFAARRKAILAALGTLVLALVGATTEGLSGTEFAMTATSALTAAVVYIVRNVTSPVTGLLQATSDPPE